MTTYNPDIQLGLSNLPWLVHQKLYEMYTAGSLAVLSSVSKSCLCTVSHYYRTDPNWTNRVHCEIHRINPMLAHTNTPYDRRTTKLVRNVASNKTIMYEYPYLTHLQIGHIYPVQLPAYLRILPQLQHLITDYEFTSEEKKLIPRNIHTLYLNNFLGMDLREFPELYRVRLGYFDIDHIPELTSVRDLYIMDELNNLHLDPKYNYIFDQLIRVRLNGVTVTCGLPNNIKQACIDMHFNNTGNTLPACGELDNCVIRFKHKGRNLVFEGMKLCHKVKKLRIITRMNHYPSMDQIVNELIKLQADHTKFACTELYIGTENTSNTSVFVGNTRVTIEKPYECHHFRSEGYVYW